MNLNLYVALVVNDKQIGRRKSVTVTIALDNTMTLNKPLRFTMPHMGNAAIVFYNALTGPEWAVRRAFGVLPFGAKIEWSILSSERGTWQNQP